MDLSGTKLTFILIHLKKDKILLGLDCISKSSIITIHFKKMFIQGVNDTVTKALEIGTFFHVDTVQKN